MDLKCRKLTCKFNDRYACLAKEITVGKDASCTSYRRNAEKCKNNMQDISKTMFESAPDISPYRHNLDCKINCKADCLFNRDKRCHANGITVLENTENGMCGTYINK